MALANRNLRWKALRVKVLWIDVASRYVVATQILPADKMGERGKT